MGMDLWYDIVIQELADDDRRGTELLQEVENTLRAEAIAEADE